MLKPRYSKWCLLCLALCASSYTQHTRPSRAPKEQRGTIFRLPKMWGRAGFTRRYLGVRARVFSTCSDLLYLKGKVGAGGSESSFLSQVEGERRRVAILRTLTQGACWGLQVLKSDTPAGVQALHLVEVYA